MARTYTVASGHDDPASPAAAARWAALAGVPGTLVLLMAMSNLRAIAGALIAAGRSPNEPAAAIQWGSTDREHRVTGTLTSIASQCDEDGVRNPAVVVIGPVVALAPLLSGGATLAVPAMAPIQG